MQKTKTYPLWELHSNRPKGASYLTGICVDINSSSEIFVNVKQHKEINSGKSALKD